MSKEGDDLLDCVSEVVAEGDGYWHSCSGCYESVDGYSIGYPFSNAFGCHLGSGCGECGGIGAIWDTTDYSQISDKDAPDPRDALIAELVSALKPFADCVFNDNGDMTISYDAIGEDYITAYYAFRRARSASEKARALITKEGAK